jgi:hypothetical protein
MFETVRNCKRITGGAPSFMVDVGVMMRRFGRAGEQVALQLFVFFCRYDSAIVSYADRRLATQSAHGVGFSYLHAGG